MYPQDVTTTGSSQTLTVFLEFIETANPCAFDLDRRQDLECIELRPKEDVGNTQRRLKKNMRL